VGFAPTVAGMALLLALVRKDSPVAVFVPGLLLMGLGVGAMLTSSVNVVQSAFPEADQDDISGLSPSVLQPGLVPRRRTGGLSHSIRPRPG